MSKRSATITKPAGKRAKTNRPAPSSSDSPTSSTSSPVLTLEERLGPGYVATGRCGICLRDIAAIQPGGLNPKHIESGTEICSEKRRSA